MDRLDERTGELTELLEASGWLVDLLRIVATLDLPDCWIGAGAVRDLVWDTRFGAGFDPANIVDVDVVFFDPDDLSAPSARPRSRYDCCPAASSTSSHPTVSTTCSTASGAATRCASPSPSTAPASSASDPRCAGRAST